MEEITKKAAQKCFEKHCYSKGIYGINQHTAFRWNEVIEFMVEFANQQNKSTKEGSKTLLEVAQSLVDWSNKYPSGKIYSYGTAKVIESELQEVVSKAEQVLYDADKTPPTTT